MKATGAEILAFWNEWPPGDHWYIDSMDGDRSITDDDDRPALDEAEKYDLDGFGNINWQGPGDPPSDAPIRCQNWVAFRTWFTFWKRARTTTTFILEVPKGQEGEVRAVAAEKKWKVRT